jgi:aspartate ammonia-lyase
VNSFRLIPKPWLTSSLACLLAVASASPALAQANFELGVLSKAKLDAISQACDELIAGKLLDQFPVDMIQAGAGTSTNMNFNEVIANRGLELMGKHKGEYAFLHPHDDVDLSQSTNDNYPTSANQTRSTDVPHFAAELPLL